MGAVEEGAKVAGGFISALGNQPVLLVQSLIIAGVVFILYAQGTRSFGEREKLLNSVFESQANVRDILSKCVVPGKNAATEDGPTVTGQAVPLPRPRPEEGPL